MSTLADELLNDFEDTGSEGDEEQRNGLLEDGTTTPVTNGAGPDGSMVLDGDEEDVIEEDDNFAEDLTKGGVAEVEDEEEAKAKVEKMQLGGVSDVRNVAGLMKTLEPVLEVSCYSYRPCLLFLFLFFFFFGMKSNVYIYRGHSPDDFVVAFRKSHTTKTFRPKSKRALLALSRIIPNIISSHSLTRCRRPSITRSSLSTSTSVIIIPPASRSSRDSYKTPWTTPSLWR